jgi:multicomponent Na+:H+ antiporter subunit B
MEDLLLYFAILPSLLIVIALIRSNNIITVTLLSGAFSLFTVIMYNLLDAPDVAMTEAVVSVLSSVFAICTIKKIYKNNYIFQDSFKPSIFILAMICGCILVYASLDLPSFGNPNFNHYYLENTASDIGIPSTVTAILASYRGYDTLLETLVILVGGLSILLISKTSYSARTDQDFLVAKLARFIFPFILLFGLYIQMHGEISPGGGFQAGCLIAIAFILYEMACGKSILSSLKLKVIAVSGVGIYFITGLLGMLGDAAFLNYNIISENQVLGQKIGIMLVEFGVGVAVSATMLLIYLSLNYASDESKL